MRAGDSLSILSIGLTTPLGMNARATVAAMTAGIVRIAETTVLFDSGEPARASLHRHLPPDAPRGERLAFMARSALCDCLAGFRPLARALPVHLALPAEGVGGEFVEDELMRQLRAAVSEEFALDVVTRDVSGRAGFFRALQRARQHVEAEGGPVLVGGVDSMCDQTSLAYLVDADRLLGSKNPDGLLPGEGAGFMLLGAGPARGRLFAVAVGEEPCTRQRDRPNLARGLTDTLRALHRSLDPPGRVGQVLSCQTGEAFWAQEFARAYLRCSELFSEPLAVELVADSLGDVGAAAGVIQGGLALLRRRYRRDASWPALVYGCSDDGTVGACVLGAD